MRLGCLLLLSACTPVPMEMMTEELPDLAEVVDLAHPDLRRAVDLSHAPDLTQAADTCTNLGSFSGSGFQADLYPPDANGVLDNIVFLGLGTGASVPVAGFEVYGTPAQILGQHDLAAGGNANYKTCTQCIRVWLGCDNQGNCQSGPYFQKKGSANFTQVASSAGQMYAGTLTDVELIEVTIDDMTLLSTPVPSGRCVRLPSFTFSSHAELTSGPMGSGGSVGETAGNATAAGCSGDC